MKLKTILIADASVTDREQLKMVLSGHYQVMTVSSPAEAASILRASEPVDFLLLSIRGSGENVQAAWQEVMTIRQLPAIAILDKPDSALEKMALDSGVVEVLTGTIQPENILLRIHSLLRLM